MAVDPEVKALARQIADLEEQVRAVSTARQIARSTVPVHDGTGVVDMLVPDALGRGVTAATELPEVREKIDAAQAELEQLESKLGDAEGELSGLRERLSTAEGEIASIGDVAGSAAEVADTALVSSGAALAAAENAQAEAGSAAAAADAALASSGSALAAAEAAQAEADAIAARGTDLITNGNAVMGLRNFSQFQLVQGDQPIGTAGSFYAGTGGQVVRYLDELVPVDPSKPLLASMWVKQTTPGVTSVCYFGMEPFDVDGLSMQPNHYMERAGTRTTLAADLKPGDTTIQLTSAANWWNGSPAGTAWARLTAWNYVDGKGKAWPAGTYSRNTWGNLWDPGAISGNTITLRTPWAGPLIEAGTEVSCGSTGGSFMYARGIAAASVPSEWTKLVATAPFEGIHTDSTTAATTSWPIATAQARPLILANYSVSGGTSRQLFAGISLSETRAAQATANAKPGLFFSTNAPTVANTAPLGSIWFRTNASGQVIGQWQQTAAGTASTWTPRAVTSEVIANLDVGKLVAGSANLGTAVAQKIAAASGQFIELDVAQLVASGAVIDEAVVQKLFADVVVARMAVADEFIGENAILNGAVTADKLHVDEAFINKLFVNELLVNALSGRTITGAIIRSSATGSRVEMQSNGLVFFGMDGIPGGRIQSGEWVDEEGNRPAPLVIAYDDPSSSLASWISVGRQNVGVGGGVEVEDVAISMVGKTLISGQLLVQGNPGQPWDVGQQLMQLEGLDLPGRMGGAVEVDDWDAVIRSGIYFSRGAAGVPNPTAQALYFAGTVYTGYENQWPRTVVQELREVHVYLPQGDTTRIGRRFTRVGVIPSSTETVVWEPWKVEGEDTGWLNLTSAPMNGFSVAPSKPLQGRRIDNRVYLRGQLYRSAAPDVTAALVLPEQLRPSETVWYTTVPFGTTPTFIEVREHGVLSITSAAVRTSGVGYSLVNQGYLAD